MDFDFTAEQVAFKESVERFARDVVAPRAAAIDESSAFPADVLNAAAGLGLLGVTIPAAQGGAGRDYLSYVLAIEAIARASATVAVSLVVTNSLVAELVAHASSRPVHDWWLRRLARGEALGAFALSEPGAGTDAANQQTTAVHDGNVYRIVGRKIWVTNAEAAAVAVVIASTQPGARRDGITAFLVPLDTSGISRTSRQDSLGVRGLGCMDLDFDVQVGADH